MIINSIKDGRVLYKGVECTIKKALQTAISKQVDLSYADLRKSDLSDVDLDGLYAPGACFWGADLSNAGMSDCQIQDCDFRLANLKEVCFADSDLTNGDFRGASFIQTVLDNSLLSGGQFSCPTILRIDLRFVKDLKGCVFHHLGETLLSMSRPPVFMRTPLSELFIFDDAALIDGDIYDIADLPESLQLVNKTAGFHENSAHKWLSGA